MSLWWGHYSWIDWHQMAIGLAIASFPFALICGLVMARGAWVMSRLRKAIR